MVEKQVKISVTTEVDAANVDDLSQKIQELQNSMVNIDFNIDDASINDLSDLVDKIDGENVELHIDTDDGELTEAYALVTDLDGNVTRINIDTDDSSLTEVQEEINKLSDNSVEVNVIADNTVLTDTSNIIEEINNLPVSVEVLVDTGDVEALQNELTEATSEVERLESELSGIEMGSIDGDFDTVSIELENAQTRVEELQSSLDNLNASSTSDISGSFDEIGSSADNANTEIDELQGSLDIMNASALMGISSEIGALGDKAEGMAQDMNQAAISVGQLSTNTGIAEPQLVDMINHISNATFPQNEAIAYVDMLNQMGVKADRLGDSATNIDRINDATGMGYQNAMQLVRGFGALGVQGDNLESTFNAVAYAEANSIGGADEMGTILKRQAGTLNEYHVGVDAATVAISDLTHKYGSAMKAGGALSQALKDNNGDLRAVEQQLGLQAGALTNATDLTGQYQGKLMELADEEAEHKSLLDQLGAGFEDLTLKLSPVLSPLASLLGLIGSASSFAVGINGLLTLGQSMRDFEIGAKLAKIANIEFSLSFLTNPIFLVVAAIAALVAILAYLYFNNEQVRQAIDNLGQTFMWVGQIIYTSFVNAINWVIGALQNLWNYIITLGGLLPANVNLTGNQIIDTILKVILFIATLPLQLGMIFTNTIAKVLGFKGNFIQTLWSTAMDAVNKFSNAIQGIGQAIQSCLNWAYNIFMNHPIVQAAQWLGNQISNAFSALGLGQHSPGKIYKAMYNEIGWTSELLQKNSLIGDASKLGANISDSFGTPELGVNTDLSNVELLNGNVDKERGFQQVNNFYFNDTVVDNDKRMEKICDYITRKLRFNNETAGRGV